MSSLHVPPMVSMTNHHEGVFFQLIDAAEAVLVEEPLDRLDHVQLGLCPEKGRIKDKNVLLCDVIGFISMIVCTRRGSSKTHLMEWVRGGKERSGGGRRRRLDLSLIKSISHAASVQKIA